MSRFRFEITERYDIRTVSDALDVMEDREEAHNKRMVIWMGVSFVAGILTGAFFF